MHTWGVFGNPSPTSKPSSWTAGFIWKVMEFSAALDGVRKEWANEGFGFSSEVLRFEVCKMAEEWISWR
jgi:hypothetical protein